MRRNRFGLAVAAALASAGMLVSGCTATTVASDQAVPVLDDPWEVAGAASSTSPSGPRPGVPDTDKQADNGDSGPIDTLALNAIADIEEYWRTEYSQTFRGNFKPASKYISWSATAPESESVKFCLSSTYQLVNAAYCPLDHTIGWDRSVLLPLLVDKYKEMSVVMVLAHEYGHAIQSQADLLRGFTTDALVKEQQADCLAGVFLRHVAEGNAQHFTLNTTDGLNGVLGAAVAVRDRDPNDPHAVHGSAFERVTAVQMGYTQGAKSCKDIDEDEIAQRRAGLPITFEDGERDEQLPVNEENLSSLAEQLAKSMPVKNAPKFVYTGLTRDCAAITTTELVSYCPGSNTIDTDLPAMAERAGEETRSEEEPLSAIVTGDYDAAVVFVSRYALAVQQDRELPLTGAETAGLRTACLSGVLTTKLSEPGSDPRLSAGDLDEAVSGLLADGLAAADVNGKVVPSGYQRLEAFRTGVLEGEQACLKKFE
ncbi:metallopeptidase [Nocardia mangyaensis]|uniref:Metallopeptidase n=1 Tax=Nocardia mangyaensis TaxID=2213200 RepID=A0A1J0VPH8_9NOCA|nr:metallopeptidase [Nocardia mangyaensis]APE33940.1 metallopeptidase [Nocardia mangyaensis]